MILVRHLSGAVLLASFGCTGYGCSDQNAPAFKVAAPADNHDESIVPVSEPAASPKVQNGDVYDKAVLKAAGIKVLIVPDTEKVERTRAGGSIELYVKKTQSFMGHPPEPLTLEGVRKRMGCAARTESGHVTVATYGEFSTIEGGSAMKLLFRVPEGISIETRSGLTFLLTNKPDGRKFSFGSAFARPGWTAIPMEPDLKRTAK